MARPGQARPKQTGGRKAGGQGLLRAHSRWPPPRELTPAFLWEEGARRRQQPASGLNHRAGQGSSEGGLVEQGSWLGWPSWPNSSQDPPVYSILLHFLVPGLFQPFAQGGGPGRASIIPLPWLAQHCGTGMACSARPHVLSVQKSAPRHVFSSCSHLEWHRGPFVLKGTLKMNESAPSCDSPKG